MTDPETQQDDELQKFDPESIFVIALVFSCLVVVAAGGYMRRKILRK